MGYPIRMRAQPVAWWIFRPKFWGVAVVANIVAAGSASIVGHFSHAGGVAVGVIGGVCAVVATVAAMEG